MYYNTAVVRAHAPSPPLPAPSASFILPKLSHHGPAHPRRRTLTPLATIPRCKLLLQLCPCTQVQVQRLPLHPVCTSHRPFSISLLSDNSIYPYRSRRRAGARPPRPARAMRLCVVFDPV